MVSRLKPLSISMDFQNRPYRLGETMRIKVALEPAREVEIREGRVDLVCQESYTETFTMMKPVAGSSGTGTTAGVSMASVPRQVTKTHKETYVHSSAAFIRDSRIGPGSAVAHEVRLQIQPEPPPHAPEARVNWTLVTVVDVARARDVRTQRKISVDLG